MFEKVEKKDIVESPGMKYKHYAPNTKCMLVFSSEEEKQINEINKIIMDLEGENKKVCVIGFLEHKSKVKCLEYFSISKKGDLEMYAKEIYSVLRKVDGFNCDIILIEGVKETRNWNGNNE